MSDEMDEIWALYLDDGTQSLDQMESSLLALQDGNPAELPDEVSALFRAVHTFKGNSRVLGLAVVESRAHVAEDLIGLVRDEGVPMDEEIIDILLYAGDILRDMLEETSATRADVTPDASEELMQRLNDKIARCKGEDPAPAEEPVADVVDAVSEAETAPEPEPEADPEPVAEAEPEPEPVAEEPEAEPEAAPEPEAAQADPEPEAAPAGDSSAEAEADEVDDRPVQSASKRLIDDPSYKDIFTGMVNDATRRFKGYMGDYETDADEAHKKVKREADNLDHAATQMGLTEWSNLLKEFHDQPFTDAQTAVEQLAGLLLQIEELARIDLAAAPEPKATVDGEATFFDKLAECLPALAELGRNWTVGEDPDQQAIQEHTNHINSVAEERGLIRVADAALRLGRSKDAREFRTSELRLYEELSAVERVLTEEAAASNISPSQLLRTWCANHAFETLTAIDKALAGLKSGENLDGHYASFARQMRLVFHACSHHNLGTAAQLAMSLIDLFDRLHTSGNPPDSILMHIGRSFVDTIELVFDALEQGEIPDTNHLDVLFEQASNAAFLGEGLMTATAIERRLSLPEQYHRVLSPESVRTASAAIEARKHFYIIRTDINDKEDLAEQFLTWIGNDNVDSITNVTVFRDEDTLFEFLIATHMEQSAVMTDLVSMDPTGKYLSLEHSLEDNAIDEDAPQENVSDVDASLSQGQGLTTEMLESISEVAASQAMVNHMLSDLSDMSIADSVEAALKAAEQDFEKGRNTIRGLVADLSARLQEVTQVEAQLVAQMAHLQEQTVSIRSRPLEMLIRPLAALVSTLSRKNKNEAKLTSAGGEMTMDVTLMDHLRKMLRVILTERVGLEGGAAQNVHLSFHRDEERVLVTIEDDGGDFDEADIMPQLDPMLRQTTSDLRMIEVPGGGMRFYLSMPLSMVVLEGMVVGIEGVRYVIPVDAIQSIVQPPKEALQPISAAQGQMVIQMDDGSMISVHCLNRTIPNQITREDKYGNRRVFVVLGVGEKSLAIPVDELMGQQLVLLRPLRGVLRHMKNLTGIALLAGGEVGMVLSTNAVVAQASEAA